MNPNCLPYSILVMLMLGALTIVGVQTTIDQPPSVELVPISSPCTVWTDQPMIPIRVGPGLNRAIWSYLPSSESFTVLGQAAAEDESLWWQIQVEATDQAWVAQADVLSNGDCSAVPIVTAPPIVQPPIEATPIPSPTVESVPPPPNTAASQSIAATPTQEQPPVLIQPTFTPSITPPNP